MPPASRKPDKDPYLGAVINDHITLTRLLGTGGMSRVYATISDPCHPVRAVKLLLDGLLKVDDAVARFEREARIMMALEHPNVVPVIEYGVARLPPFNGIPFIVMKLVRGKTLEDMMQELRDAGSNGRIPLEQAVIYLSQVCAALIDAHEKGIIHRDIKPSNVFVETHPGVTQVLLADFGVSCFQDSTHFKVTLAERNEVMGTPNYMAPEQAAGGQALTTMVDVYALGVMAYELICGRLPIEETTEDTTRAYLLRVITETPKQLKHVMPGVTGLLNELIMGCLEKNPRERPTVREFRDGLAHATGTRINRSVRPSAPEPKMVDLAPPGVPFDAVPTKHVPTLLFGSSKLATGPMGKPRVSSKPAEDPLDTVATTQRERPTDPQPPLLPMHRLSGWSTTFIIVGFASAIGIVGAAVYTREFSETAAAGNRPRPVRHTTNRITASRQDAGTAAIVAVRTPRDAGFVHPDVPIRRAVAPPVPSLPRAESSGRVEGPDPRIAEVNAHGAACMAALSSRRPPRNWQDRCRAYVAVRCPATGSRAVDCDLVQLMLRRATPRPRPRPEPVEDSSGIDDEDVVEPAP